MATRTWTLLLSVALALGSSPAHALSRCKVKINHKDGTILVSAKEVSGALRWGTEAGLETNALSDPACITDGKAKDCTLGAEGSAEKITPPPRCTLYLADDAGTCAAYMRDCTPGVRGCRQQVDANTVAIAVNAAEIKNAPCAGGVWVGPVPWYFGAPGEDCDSVCAAVGLVYDDATRIFAGSDGTDERCAQVLQALQDAGRPVPTDSDGVITDTIGASEEARGCYATATEWKRGVGTTNSTSKGPNSMRACVCSG